MVKREIKLLAFIDDGGGRRWVREDRWNNAPYARVPSEDKAIEVEEPAGPIFVGHLNAPRNSSLC